MRPIFRLPAAALLGISCLAQAQPSHYGYGPTPFGPPPQRTAPRPNPAAEAAAVLREGWKIYDVVANGRSASAYYRMQLNSRSRQAPPRPL